MWMYSRDSKNSARTPAHVDRSDAAFAAGGGADAGAPSASLVPATVVSAPVESARVRNLRRSIVIAPF